MAKVRAHVYISGRVQGVYFRYFARRLAEQHGLTGWVRNLPDGRVEALFEGERESVSQILEWCHQGPPGALVGGVQVAWEQYTGEYSRFAVR